MGQGPATTALNGATNGWGEIVQSERIVTGNQNGKSAFLDGMEQPAPAVFKAIDGFVVSNLWSTAPGMPIPTAIGDPTVGARSLLPEPGGTSLLIVQFPPDAVLASLADPQAAMAEYATKLPGLFEKFEPANPGFHKTETVDYAILLSGELWLELDGGAVRRLRPGDVVVQNATRHAWRNKTDAPAVIAFVLIGCHAA
jgi:Cupin domain